MTFDEVLEQVRELLQREGRVSYRALKRRFGLDDDYLADLTAELIDAKRLAVDEDGKVLLWTGGTAQQEETEKRGIGESGRKREPETRRHGEAEKDSPASRVRGARASFHGSDPRPETPDARLFSRTPSTDCHVL